MFSLKRNTSAAALSIMAAVLAALPAMAQYTIDSKGRVFDPYGNKVKEFAVVMSAGTVAPGIAPGTVVTQERFVGSSTVPLQQTVITPIPGSVNLGTTDFGTTIMTQPSTFVKKTVVTTTSSGSAPAVTTFSTTSNTTLSDALIKVLDNRRAELAREIAQVNPADAITLKGELADISAREMAAEQANMLTYDEAMQLAGDLDLLNTRTFAFLGMAPLSPLVTFDEFGARQIAVTNMQLF